MAGRLSSHFYSKPGTPPPRYPNRSRSQGNALTVVAVAVLFAWPSIAFSTLHHSPLEVIVVVALSFCAEDTESPGDSIPLRGIGVLLV